MIKLVIFDFDGVIADSFELNVGIFNELADEYGFKKAEKKEIKRLRDMRLWEFMKEMRVSFFKIPFILRKGRKYFTERSKEVKIVKEMDKVIRELKRKGIKIAVLSSNSDENIIEFLRKNKVNVDCVCGRISLFGKAKGFKRVMRKFNSGRAFYIGDETRDMESGRKAGLKTIGVVWGMNSEKALKKAGADYIAKNPRDILRFI